MWRSCWPSAASDKAGAYLRVIDELVPAAAHVTEQYANNLVEADHGRLKAWLRPMRGLQRFRSAARLVAGHAFVQTCVVAITNLPLTPHHRSACLLHSPSWHRPCDQYYLQTRRLPRQAGRNRALGVRPSVLEPLIKVGEWRDPPASGEPRVRAASRRQQSGLCGSD